MIYFFGFLTMLPGILMFFWGLFFGYKAFEESRKFNKSGKILSAILGPIALLFPGRLLGVDVGVKDRILHLEKKSVLMIAGSFFYFGLLKMVGNYFV